MNFPVQHDELTTLQYLIANYFPTKDAAQAQAVLSRLVTAAAIEAQGVPEELRNALQQIADWNSHSLQLAVEHGSIGVRDFYRQIALDALASAPPAPQADGTERETLRAQQANAVMPLIGPLLDAWERSFQDVRSEHPELDKQIRRINRAMEDAHPAPQAKPQPLTNEQREAVFTAANGILEHGAPMSWEHALVDAVEAALGITKE